MCGNSFFQIMRRFGSVELCQAKFVPLSPALKDGAMKLLIVASEFSSIDVPVFVCSGLVCANSFFQNMEHFGSVETCQSKFRRMYETALPTLRQVPNLQCRGLKLQK